MSWCEHWCVGLDRPLKKLKYCLEDYMLGSWAEEMYHFFKNDIIQQEGSAEWDRLRKFYAFEFSPLESLDTLHEVFEKELLARHRYNMNLPTNEIYLLFSKYAFINDVEEKNSWDWQTWWLHTFGTPYPLCSMQALCKRSSVHKFSGYYDYLRSSTKANLLADFVKRGEDLENPDMIKYKIMDRVIAIRAFEWLVEFFESNFVNNGGTQIKLLRVYEHYQEDFKARTFQVDLQQLKENPNKYEVLHNNCTKESKDNIELFVFNNNRTL